MNANLTDEEGPGSWTTVRGDETTDCCGRTDNVGPMVDEVSDVLERFESRHDVRIVAARDLGSRAWNLDDSDSDVDVRALFVQRPIEYATLDGYESSHALETTGQFEVRGWNVRRFAELVAGSDPTAFEFLHSPIRYREFDPLSDLERDVGDSFEPMALYHHHRSLARRQYRKYLQGRLLENGELAYLVCEELEDGYVARRVADGTDDDAEPDPVIVPRGEYEEGATDRTVKRHLYVARGVLYAQYVAKTHRFPPLDFPRFLETDVDRDRFDPELVETTKWLARKKRRGEGDEEVGRLFEPDQIDPPPIDPVEHAGRRVDRTRVDRFVRETFERVRTRSEFGE